MTPTDPKADLKARIASLRDRLSGLQGRTYSAAYDAENDYAEWCADALDLIEQLSASQLPEPQPGQEDGLGVGCEQRAPESVERASRSLSEDSIREERDRLLEINAYLRGRVEGIVRRIAEMVGEAALWRKIAQEIYGWFRLAKFGDVAYPVEGALDAMFNKCRAMGDAATPAPAQAGDAPWTLRQHHLHRATGLKP